MKGKNIVLSPSLSPLKPVFMDLRGDFILRKAIIIEIDVLHLSNYDLNERSEL
jgi:hypothetical protein